MIPKSKDVLEEGLDFSGPQPAIRDRRNASAVAATSEA